MAVSYSYNSTYTNSAYIFRATSGGTVFSANVAGAVFDYFTDTAVVNDAIYFSSPSALSAFSNLVVNVGTAMAGTGITGVWEYYSFDAMWETCHNLTDPTAGFTVTGSNTIVFPIQAEMSYNLTVNGIASYIWIRYRITAITTITEGGANQTTRPTVSNGILNVIGGTDAAPATFKGMYDWIIVNAPEIDAINPATSIFKFNNIKLGIGSRLKSTNEQVFIGNGSCAYPHNISYLEAGTKVGTDGWKDCSSFFWCVQMGTNMLTTSDSTKLYGGVFDSFINFINGRHRTWSSYMGASQGEIIGTTFVQASGYFGVTPNVNKITIPGGIISSTFPAAYPTNMRISDPRTYIWGVYNNGGTISGVSYALPTTSIFNANQGGLLDPQIILINPSPSLPEQTGTPKVMARTISGLVNITKCFFYDTSAGTFTDYTTQAQSTTADDVPLSGDVGDIYYFHYSAWSSSYTAMLSFIITNQSNDYEYIWEHYVGSAWVTLNKAANYDGTANFTTSGKIYLKTNNSTTVNGTTGVFARLRIITKGLASPVISRVQASYQTYGSDWKIFEKMSCVFKVLDEAGLPIQDVAVNVADTNGANTALTTDVNGLTTSTDITISTTQFDPTESDANYNVSKISMNPFTITISKAGYETYISEFNITEKIAQTITLKTTVKLRKDEKGNVYYAITPEKGSKAIIIKS